MTFLLFFLPKILAGVTHCQKAECAPCKASSLLFLNRSSRSCSSEMGVGGEGEISVLHHAHKV